MAKTFALSVLSTFQFFESLPLVKCLVVDCHLSFCAIFIFHFYLNNFDSGLLPAIFFSQSLVISLGHSQRCVVGLVCLLCITFFKQRNPGFISLSTSDFFFLFFSP